MTEFASLLEIGDFYVEYAGSYLGEGEISLSFAPEFQEVRGDAMKPLQGKRVRALRLNVAAALGGAAPVMTLLDGGGDFTAARLDASLFTGGAALRLYPADRQGSPGYEFPRAYLSELRQRHSYLNAGGADVNFRIEADGDGRTYCSRLTPGALPQGLTIRPLPDAVELTRQVAAALAGPLAATVDQTLCRGRFAPGDAGSYGLFLDGCSEWSSRHPRRFDFTLIARFPLEDKDRIDAAMLAAADFLHGHNLSLSTIAIACCRISGLTFDSLSAQYGQYTADTRLNFSLIPA